MGENLKRFIEDAGRPLITEFKQEHAHKIFEMEITHHFILFVDKAHTDFNAMLKTLRTVAKDHRQKMTFVHLDIGNEENEGIAEFFGVTKVSFKYLPISLFNQWFHNRTQAQL